MAFRALLVVIGGQRPAELGVEAGAVLVVGGFHELAEGLGAGSGRRRSRRPRLWPALSETLRSDLLAARASLDRGCDSGTARGSGQPRTHMLLRPCQRLPFKTSRRVLNDEDQTYQEIELLVSVYFAQIALDYHTEPGRDIERPLLW